MEVSGWRKERFSVISLARMVRCTTFLRKSVLGELHFSCLRGRLLEVNTRLLEEPSLLNEKV